MAPRQLVGSFVLLSFGSFACGDDGGAGAGGGTDTSSATSTASSSVASTSSGGACLGECSAPPPPGWNGPVLVADDDVPSCASPVLDGGLATDPAMPDTALTSTSFACGCSCTADPASCADISVDPGCDAGSLLQVAADTCVDAVVLDPPADEVALGAVDVGACTPAAEMRSPGGVAFVMPRDVCGIPVTPAGCDGTEVCVPTTDARVCVWRHGAIGCGQVAAYPNESILVAAYEDTRACAPGTCACGPSANGCDGVVELFAEAACTSPAETLVAAAGCSTLAQSTLIASARYTLNDPTFSCPVAPEGQPAVTGEVVANADEVYTLCCRD